MDCSGRVTVFLISVCRIMDSDSSYEAPSEVSEDDEEEEQEASTDHGGDAVIPHTLDDPPVTGTKLRRPYHESSKLRRATETKEQRWQRLQCHYNDQYLNALNESSDACTDGLEAAQHGVDCAQVGLSKWSGLEKAKFFHSLSRNSKADIRGIATGVQSKSELEVYEYLRVLEDEDRNRHLYAEEVKNVSHSDIPAAAELSRECEVMLEDAADALIVYQERFDQALGEQRHHDDWLIDSVRAQARDQLVDAAEDGISPNHNTPITAGSFFRLSSWLSLTERVFMNSDPSKSDHNWLIHAAKDELPAITQEAISDFYGLALSQLHKIMQTSIFCAESRIRSVNDRGYTAKAVVREQDVAAAVGLVGVQKDRSQFWLGLARRNLLRVVEDHRKKGRGRKTRLNYDEIERILSKTLTTKHGRRSVSGASKSSTVSDDSDSTEECEIPDDMFDAEVGTSDHSAREESVGHDDRSQHPFRCLDTRGTTDRRNQSSDDADSASTSWEISSVTGDEQERHLDILDQINSRRAELQLCHDMGWAPPEDIESQHAEEVEPNGGHVCIAHRKARPELEDWRESISGYAESWEHGELPDEAKFVANASRTKRRRIDHDILIQHDLPFRIPCP